MAKNTCIHCTVSNCKYNTQTDNYCTLEAVQIGTHESEPKVCECVDCQSFIKG